MRTKQEIRVKDGNGGILILPAGLPVMFIKERPSSCYVQHTREKPYCVRVASAFRAPSLRKLEAWSEDGICDSVAGERVEPDGWDCHGSPSWLLAMGLI